MKTLVKKFKNWQSVPFIKRLKTRFPAAEFFLVGGAVRDAILGRATQDFDFVVRGVGKAELEKFLAQQGKVSLVGKRFGVFKFRPKKWEGPEIDIALPRTEHSVNLSGAYRDFKINSSAKLKIEADLSRRDFTINAMAWDINQQKLIDPFNGLADLKNGVIKTVGDAKERLAEDYSRILRAIRFACQLNFEIETKTWRQITKSIKNLNQKVDGQFVVAREIIAKELVKMVNKNAVWALELLDKSGAIKILLPELLKMKNCPQPKNFHSEGDVWQHTIIALQKLAGPEFKKEFSKVTITNEIYWGLIFHDLGKPYTITMADRLRFNNHDVVSGKKFQEIAQRLKLSAAGLDVDKTEKLIARHMLPTHGIQQMKETTIEKYFFNADFPGQELLMLIFADIAATIPPSGKPDFSSYHQLKARTTKLKKIGPKKPQLPKPLINGHDLIKKFKLKPGPKIGELLVTLREAQLRGKIKNQKQSFDYIKKFTV